MGEPKSKQLLVEGMDDLYVVVHLMKHYIEWPEDKDQAPVAIQPMQSVDGVLNGHFISAKLKESVLRTLGLIIDADDKFDARWQRIRQLFGPTFPSIPQHLPRDGLVTDNAEGLRLGVWIMPDCASAGMMETFLRFCIPAEPNASALWDHAEVAFSEAKRKHSPCRAAHEDKAKIHTWLAWQDPPGERMGLALKRKIFDPRSPCAAPFAAWFKRLYGL